MSNGGSPSRPENTNTPSRTTAAKQTGVRLPPGCSAPRGVCMRPPTTYCAVPRRGLRMKSIPGSVRMISDVRLEIFFSKSAAVRKRPPARARRRSSNSDSFALSAGATSTLASGSACATGSTTRSTSTTPFVANWNRWLNAVNPIFLTDTTCTPGRTPPSSKLPSESEVAWRRSVSMATTAPATGRSVVSVTTRPRSVACCARSGAAVESAINAAAASTASAAIVVRGEAPGDRIIRLSIHRPRPQGAAGRPCLPRR